MTKGIILAIAACFIWGLIFIVPGYLQGFTSFEVCLGRYIIFGSFSILLLLFAKFKNGFSQPKSMWLRALSYSLFICILYYTLLVLSVQYSTPALSALILGISPISISFYGNWLEKEGVFKSLLFPALLIFVGLICINAPHIHTEAISDYLMGIGAAFGALFCWTWYVVANARVLKRNPGLSSGDWSSMIGATSLFWVFFIGGGMVLSGHLEIGKFAVWTPDLKVFVIGCAVLGLLCSWLGAYLWNKASTSLPVSFAGQLTIFETIFAVLFYYVIEARLPPTLESAGIALFLLAILVSVFSVGRSPVAEKVHS